MKIIEYVKKIIEYVIDFSGFLCYTIDNKGNREPFEK